MMLDTSPPAANIHHVRQQDDLATYRAIRLFLPEEFALPAVASYPAGGQSDRATLLDRFRSQANHLVLLHRFLRFRYFIGRRSEQADDPPLGPQAGVSSKDALALALRVGLQLDADEISDVLRTSTTTIGKQLYRARRQLLPNAQQCPVAPASRLGFFDEQAFGSDGWSAQNQHLFSCSACNEVTAAFQEVDQQLIERMSTIFAPQGDIHLTDRQTAWNLAPVIAATAALMFIIALVLGLGSLLVGYDRVLGGPSEPAAIVPEPLDSTLSGWLITSTIDNVSAINLATGEHRSLVSVNVESGQPPIISLSPDGSRIAFWTFQDGTRIASTVEIISIDGESLFTWRWDRQNSPGRFDGWLNDQELLFVRAPGQMADESNEEFIQRQTRENELFVVDLETREQRTIFQGSIVVADPSPDQRYIAILDVYDRNTAEHPGRSLQIRPLNDESLGEPVFELAGRYPLENTRPVWSSDGGNMFFTALAESESNNDEDDAQQVIEIHAWSHDTGVQRVATGREGTRIRLLGASPDGSNVIYLQSRAPGNSQEWDLSRAWLDDRGAVVLAESIAYPFFFSSGVTWLDGGNRAIISDSRTHYFHQRDPTRGVRAGSTRYLLVSNDDDVELISTELGLWGVDAWGTTTLSWFEVDQLDAVLGTGPSNPMGTFGTPETVDDRGMMRFTGELSNVSPGGEFAVFHHTSTGGPLVWRFEQNSGRLLGGSPAPTDISWSQGSPALIGVQNDDEESVISMFAPRSTRVADFYDNRSGDPAQISDNPDLDYARPMLSPDGNRMSFIVVDQDSGEHELWVADDQSGASVVFRWSVPDAALVDPPVSVTWTSSLTLLLFVPAEWNEGYPVELALIQIQLPETAVRPATVDVDEIYSITPHGDARGITMGALVFNPRTDLVAYRLRNYRSMDPTRSVRDSIVVASTRDVAQSITMARGRIGEGLSWSNDGEWLVYPIGNGLMVSKWDGSERQTLVADDNSVRYPLWIPGEGIYYTRGPADSPTLMHIAVR